MHFITSSALCGIESVPIHIETDISRGIGNFTIVGLPDTSVKEARERIRAAIKNSGFSFPRGRITINLAPADLRKQGPVFDLPIALSILAAQGEFPWEKIRESVVLGELALDGKVRPVRGVLSATLMARKMHMKNMFIPFDNAQEASIIPSISVFAITSLKQLTDILLDRANLERTTYKTIEHNNATTRCFSFIRGQALAKRGLEIAAAGGHNILLSGPPGTGKTLLAKSFASILPPLSEEESVEVTNVASVAGMLSQHSGLIRERPFRSPHHSSSAVSLVGGGTWPVPGEISLAHHGVLFLDELPEFSRHSLEQLRGPIEDGMICISRAHTSVKFPAQFLLIAAMNPCPCGHATDPKKPCVCTIFQVQQYQKRVSGPLMDRFDIRIEVSHVAHTELLSTTRSEPSEMIRARVVHARQKQTDRFNGSVCHTNAEISPEKMDEWCAMSPDATALLASAIETQALSPRAATRIRKVARTIADLASADIIHISHIAEALQFRGVKEC